MTGHGDQPKRTPQREFSLEPTDEAVLFEPASAIGQHILLDHRVIQQACELIPEGAHCVEIGPGPGTLTRELIHRAGRVVAYEIDERCRPLLDEVAQQGSLSVRWESILHAPEAELEDEMPFHIVGNIPFQISEPLITKLTKLNFESAVLLVGEKLAKSLMTDDPDSRSWARMSLISSAFFEVERILEVPRKAFDPPPPVDAALVRLTRKDNGHKWRSDASVQAFRAIIEGGSQNVTVAKALSSVMVTSKGEAETRYNKGNKIQNRRAERRIANMAIRQSMTEVQGRDRSRHSLGPDQTTQDMLTLIRKSIDERLLSRPLGGLDNRELSRVCSAITAAINRRKKRR